MESQKCKNATPVAGLEPAIAYLGGKRRIHWATRARKVIWTGKNQYQYPLPRAGWMGDSDDEGCHIEVSGEASSVVASWLGSSDDDDEESDDDIKAAARAPRCV